MDIAKVTLINDAAGAVNNSDRLIEIALGVTEDLLGNRGAAAVTAAENKAYLKLRDVLFMKYCQIELENFIPSLHNLYQNRKV